MKNLSLLLLLLISPLTAADRIDFFKNCVPDSVGTTVNYVDVTPCSANPCGFLRNQNVTLSISFRPENEITSARPVVYGINGVMKMKNPFPLQEDACQDMVCPVAPNTDVIYTTSIFIRPEYPQMRVVAQFGLEDQEMRNVVCIVVPVEITD